MKCDALGMIETKGLIRINRSGADAMVKSTNNIFNR